MRTVLHRTLLGLPVALLAVGLFAATSQAETWVTWSSDTLDTEIFTGGEGVHEGLITAVIVGPDLDQGELRITLSGPEVSRGLEVGPADGSQPADAVRDGYVITRGLPNSCLESTDDTDAPSTTACTVPVRVRFDGPSGRFEDIQIVAAIGNWSDVPEPESSFAVEVSYDDDPPAE